MLWTKCCAIMPARKAARADCALTSFFTMSEHTYEAQNDTRLDDLHSKLRTLRGVRVHAPIALDL